MTPLAREGAKWSEPEDRDLQSLVRRLRPMAVDAELRAIRWGRVALALCRTVRAARSRWNILQACARLCRCAKTKTKKQVTKKGKRKIK